MTLSDVNAVPTPALMPSARKLAWIAALALATAVPIFLVSQLIGEREDRAAATRADIVRAWGPQQQVSGPTMVLPVMAKDGGSTQSRTNYLKLAARTLDVKVATSPSARRRGLFAATVYDATVSMSGTFELPDGFRDGGPNGHKVGTPFISLTLPGTQGVMDDDRADVAGVKAPWQTCLDAVPNDVGCRRDSGILVAEADLTKVSGDAVPFSLVLHLRGTGSIRVDTASKHATLHMAGAWPTPSFVGTDLPSTSAVSADGFTADWVLDRIGKPRYVSGPSIAGVEGAGSSVGVDLIEGTPVYRTITRVTKYGLVIVALAFSAYFLFEVTTGIRVVLFQYAMLGASLTLFTLLLLSVSEVAGYEVGYGLSALMVTLQASLYTWSVTRRSRVAAAFATLLATVFGFFYVLVGLESYALLIGAFALFLVLSIIMGVTQTVSVGSRPALDEVAADRAN